jgi:hypothetical protein
MRIVFVVCMLLFDFSWILRPYIAPPRFPQRRIATIVRMHELVSLLSRVCYASPSRDKVRLWTGSSVSLYHYRLQGFPLQVKGRRESLL